MINPSNSQVFLTHYPNKNKLTTLPKELQESLGNGPNDEGDTQRMTCLHIENGLWSKAYSLPAKPGGYERLNSQLLTFGGAICLFEIFEDKSHRYIIRSIHKLNKDAQGQEKWGFIYGDMPGRRPLGMCPQWKCVPCGATQFALLAHRMIRDAESCIINLGRPHAQLWTDFAFNEVVCRETPQAILNELINPVELNLAARVSGVGQESHDKTNP